MAPWPKISSKRRLAAVNSVGAAGENTTMSLEETRIRDTTETDPHPIHIIAVSAKTKRSLTIDIKRSIAHLDAYSDINIANLSYMTTARRCQHSYRVAIAITDMAPLSKEAADPRLEKIDRIKFVANPRLPLVGFTFTG